MKTTAVFGLLLAGWLVCFPAMATCAQAQDAEPSPPATASDDTSAADGTSAADDSNPAKPEPQAAVSGESSETEQPESQQAESRTVPVTGLVASLTIFVLAIFVGFEVITKVPPTLHTPLMSGSNAISGITVVGAIVVAGSQGHWLISLLGMLAVALAGVNVVGGFLVTHRMLSMFQRKK